MKKELLQIVRQHPDLDLESLLLLLQISATPGLSIRELADVLFLDAKHVQLKIALLAGGRKRFYSSRRRLVTQEYNLGDPRKRSLALTVAGEALAEQINNLTK